METCCGDRAREHGDCQQRDPDLELPGRGVIETIIRSPGIGQSIHAEDGAIAWPARPHAFMTL